MSNFFQKYTAHILFAGITIVGAILSLIPRDILRSYGFYNSYRGLQPPIIFTIAVIISSLIYFKVKYSNLSKASLLKRGFIETTGEILTIEETSNPGHPKNHTVQLTMKIRVKSLTSNPFEALVKTTITERGNDSFGYKTRTLDYKVGDTITIMCHPQKPEEVVIPM